MQIYSSLARILGLFLLLAAGYAPRIIAQSPLVQHVPSPVDQTLDVPTPSPSDVLTPNIRRNTPYLKIAVRAGFNLANYSNDRYIDNVPLDVGKVSGESSIYSAATGFGYQFGVDIEYPLNTGLSIVLTGEYDRVRFGSRGQVSEPCVDKDGQEHIGSSLHDFLASISYAKLAATARLNFSSWCLFTGLTADVPASTSLTRTREFSTPGCFYPNTNNSSSIHEDGSIPDPNRIHYSLRMGFGLIYPLTPRLQFVPELTLDFGFNTVNKSPNSDLGVYAVNATLRYDI